MYYVYILASRRHGTCISGWPILCRNAWRNTAMATVHRSSKPTAFIASSMSNP